MKRVAFVLLLGVVTCAPGPLAPSEDAVHQLVTTIARGYRDGALPV